MGWGARPYTSARAMVPRIIVAMSILLVLPHAHACIHSRTHVCSCVISGRGSDLDLFLCDLSGCRGDMFVYARFLFLSSSSSFRLLKIAICFWFWFELIHSDCNISFTVCLFVCFASYAYTCPDMT